MATTYVVRKGDTLWSLAQRYGTTVQALAKASGIKNPNRLSIGQQITIPSSAAPPLPRRRPAPVVPVLPIPNLSGQTSAGTSANGSSSLSAPPVGGLGYAAQVIPPQLPAMASGGAGGVGWAVPPPPAAPSLADVLSARYSSVAPSPQGADPSSFYAPGIFPTGVAPDSSSSQELQTAVNDRAASMVPTLTASGSAYAGTDPPGTADLGNVDPRVIDTIIAEAGGSGIDGMRAVAAVINNRANSRGLTPAQVVAQPYQFEGYSNPGPGALRSESDPAVRAQALQAFNDIVSGAVPDPTNGGQFYHADYITPYWASAENKNGTVNIGGNVFYLGNGAPALNAIDSATTPMKPLPAPSPLTPASMANLPDLNPVPPLPRPRPAPTAPVVPPGTGSAFTGGGWGNLGLLNASGSGSFAMPPGAVPASVQSSMPSVVQQQQANENTPRFAGQPWISGLIQKTPPPVPAAPSIIPIVNPMASAYPGNQTQASSWAPWGSIPSLPSPPPAPTYAPPTTRYTVQQMTSLNPDYEKYIAAQKANDIGPGPGSIQDIIGNYATGAVLPSMGSPPPKFITVTRPVAIPVAAAPVPMMPPAPPPMPTQPPGASFLASRGVDTSNMSAGQQANALAAMLSGNSHHGSFGV